MSKPLRIAIDDIPGWRSLGFDPAAYASDALRQWHPYYAQMSGTNTPCFREYMALVDCIESTKLHETVEQGACAIPYAKLLKCLNSIGE